MICNKMLAAVVGAAICASPCPADTPPTTYEMMIDGESFSVQLDRSNKLESRQKPGRRYEVALRVAPTQTMRLNTLQLQYDMPAKVDDDGRRPQRAVRVAHELGFSVLITDLGQPLDQAAREKAFKVLTESVTQSFRDSHVGQLEIDKPHERNFGHCEGRGVTVRYRDSQDFAQTCLVYLLTGKTFAATCVVQYMDRDSEDVLPLVKRVLDSVGPLP